MKYKVGDKVKFISAENGYSIGGVYTIEKADNDRNVVFFSDGNGNGALTSWIEPADTPKVKPIKKVTVKITDPNQIVGQDLVAEQLKVAIDNDLHVLLVGDTGTGKTSIIRELAHKQQKQLVRFSLTGETTVDDILGTKTLTNGSVEYVYSQFVNAVRDGGWVVFDELNVALPEILFALQSLLDDDKFLSLPQNAGEVVKAHKDFRFFATMNPVDEYAGTKDLNKAFKSRFHMIINVDYPEPEVEVEIVKQKCNVPEKTARLMVDFGQAVRKAKREDEVFYTCSTRDLIQWGALSNHLPIDQAFEVTVLNKANGDRDRLVEILTTIGGEYDKLELDGFELSIDYFSKRAKEILKGEKKLKDDRLKFNGEIDETTEKIRKEVIAKLVKQVE
jgi:MoxR-like ATPase